MPELRTEAVGPYLALIAYARAAGARDHDQAKALVDDVLATYPTMTLPDLVPVIDGRAGGLINGTAR